MCGRYASFRKAQQIADEFDVVTLSQAALDLEPSWNIPPTAPVRIIVERPGPAEERSAGGQGRGDVQGPVRAMHSARWGLVPPWADSFSMGARMFNARSETAATKPSFRKPFSTSRCLVVADGYYEWHTSETGEKTPYYIFPTHGESIAFAGLFSWWPDPEEPENSPDRWVLTTTILTAAARDGLEEIHEREPVMLT
ncbi:MAG TPA: SOS response-associated peptidase, partial [Beutenbergiaceae bacterium]|nr:SOS response-associated peptidase [Beutenbergiaceae bacterium]